VLALTIPITVNFTCQILRFITAYIVTLWQVDVGLMKAMNVALSSFF